MDVKSSEKKNTLDHDLPSGRHAYTAFKFPSSSSTFEQWAKSYNQKLKILKSVEINCNFIWLVTCI